MRQLVFFGMGLFIMFGVFLSGSKASAATSLHKVCGGVSTGYARCFATVLTDSGGVQPLVSGSPQGYGPNDFRAAYANNLRTSSAVGIVTAFDDPHILNDVNIFSKTYGLSSLASCSSATQLNCLAKVSQTGSSILPASNSDWAVETSLDVESVHGQCPGCRINLVEAASSSIANLSKAAAEATALGSNVVSNSYGGSESPKETSYDSNYRKTGVNIVVSSGDSGYGTNYPAASPGVLAVGGTSLQLKNGRVVSETAWIGAGSGCSLFEPKPSWQHDKKCSMRSVADISADADPQTGAAIYDSTAVGAKSGWLTVGGTSLAAPLVAGIIGANVPHATLPAALYSGSLASIRDVTKGSNGSCSSYLCIAEPGYDGPTGLGVLDGF